MSQNRIRIAIWLLALGALAALLGASAVVWQRQVRLRGALDGLPDPDLPYRVPVLGINADLTQYNSESLTENLDQIADVGFSWVRQPLSWNVIEPLQGEFDWSAYDQIVEESTSRGVELVVVLLDAPGWAADSSTAPPRNLSDFAAFAGEVASRYGDQIDVYQVWDEPNLAAGWGDQPANPVEYAALLEAAYTAIHEADPDALVITAGLAPTIETGPTNLSDVLFLRALYDNGAAPYFDAVAGKPYGFDSGPDDRRAHENVLNFSRVLLLRREMVRHGDANKPLWISHFGWNALPADWTGDPSVWGLTTPEQQAAWTRAAYERVLMEWPWVGGVILENWQPNAHEDDARWGFALQSAEGELAPVADEIRAIAELSQSALWPGVYPATTPLAEYSGEWEFSDEFGADIVENGSSAVDVPFLGSSLGVAVRRGDYRAYLYAEVDGAPPANLPRDERGGYVVLTSPDYKPRVEALTIVDGLESGIQHDAHIEADRGWDQWAIAGYVVGADIDTTSYDLAIVLLLAGAVGLSVSAISLQRRARMEESARRFPLDSVGDVLRQRFSQGVHLVLSMAAALAVWLGAALTWGGLVPNLLRRLGEGPSLLLTALTAGVFYFSPWLVLTIIALAALFVLIYARPQVGVALIMFFTPYYLLPRPLFDRAFSMVEVTSLLTIVAWAVHVAAARREQGWPTLPDLWQRMTGLDRAVALFTVVSVASVAWSALPGVAVTELRQMVLEPLIVYLVLRTLPFTREDRWRIVDLLMLTGVIVALVGFYQVATGTDIITAEEGAIRLKSVFGTPNNTALFLGRLIPIAAAVTLIDRSARRRWLYAATGVLMLAATVLTVSKGALLLGLPAGLGLIVVLWAGRIGLYVVGGGVVALLLALIPLSRLPRFASLFEFGEGSSFFRVQLWQSTLRMIRDHPLTGLGLDQFLYAYRGHYILPSAWQQPDLSQPHNVWLNYWARLGVIGLAAGIWMQVAFWRLVTRTQRALRSDASARALVVGLMGSMAAFLGHGMVDAVHFVIDLSFLFFMTLGLAHQFGAEVSHASDD